MADEIEGALGGAASGAAAGTMIAPGVGTVIGGLLGAASSFFGGRANRESQERANLQNIMFQQAQNEQNIGFQREQNLLNRGYAVEDRDFSADMSKNAVALRVADALRSGIHPLYALGAKGTEVVTSGGGFGSAPSGVAPSVKAAVADYGNMGQELSRAVTALMTKPEETAFEALQLEKIKAEIDYIKTRTRNVGSPPNAPAGDDENPNEVKLKQEERTRAGILPTDQPEGQTVQNVIGGEAAEELYAIAQIKRWLDIQGRDQLSRWFDRQVVGGEYAKGAAALYKRMLDEDYGPYSGRMSRMGWSTGQPYVKGTRSIWKGHW